MTLDLHQKLNVKIYSGHLKSVHGLADASLYWYNKVKRGVQRVGGKNSKADPAVYFWVDQANTVAGVLSCHVDYLIWGGTIGRKVQIHQENYIQHMQPLHMDPLEL